MPKAEVDPYTNVRIFDADYAKARRLKAEMRLPSIIETIGCAIEVLEQTSQKARDKVKHDRYDRQNARPERVPA